LRRRVSNFFRGAHLLEARDLTISYDHRVAVAELTLSLRQGEITTIIITALIGAPLFIYLLRRV
jgi:ABC-type Fe3+-siderophore transport system permease subunit